MKLLKLEKLFEEGWISKRETFREYHVLYKENKKLYYNIETGKYIQIIRNDGGSS